MLIKSKFKHNCGHEEQMTIEDFKKKLQSVGSGGFVDLKCPACGHIDRLVSKDAWSRLEQESEIKTSLELPEELWKRAKMRAIEEKTTVKNIVCRAIARELTIPIDQPKDHDK